MNEQQLKEKIRQTFEEVYTEQCDKPTPPELTDDTILLKTGLDSLGFAILVAQLEDELDYDPFTLDDNPYYPETFGDFVSFYYKHLPKS